MLLKHLLKSINKNKESFICPRCGKLIEYDGGRRKGNINIDWCCECLEKKKPQFFVNFAIDTLGRMINFNKFNYIVDFICESDDFLEFEEETVGM